MLNLDDVIQEALSRPEEERVVLIECLLESVSNDVDPSVREWWDAVLSDRLKEARHPETAFVEWDTVKQELFERLEQSR